MAKLMGGVRWPTPRQKKRRRLIHVDIGERVRLSRIDAGITQELPGKHAGITRAQVANIENGRGVSIETLAAIAEGLGLRADSADTKGVTCA